MLAVIRAVDDDGASLTSDSVSRQVEDALRAEFRKGRRRDLVIVASLSDGEPLNSVRDLRAARSLNPRADITAGMADEVGLVCQMAVVMCQPTHPEHGYQEWERACNRQRVRQMRAADARRRAARREAAERMAAPRPSRP